MEELLAYVGAELKKPQEEISDELVFLINSRIKPPKPVTKEDIFVRTMFLVSDEVNSYGGRFPLEELVKISNLVIDSPVIVGHTKEKLPIARNFKAELAQKDCQNWLKVWFYWLKNAKDASSLKDNIDHGIYKECSLGFVFEFPECSICGEDMRKCSHIPFKSYSTQDGEKEAYFNYRNVIRVLETSLVYRGAVPNTSMSDELGVYQKGSSDGGSQELDSSADRRRIRSRRAGPFEFVPPTKPKKSGSTANEIFHLEDFSSISGEFLIEPKYDGVRAQIHKKDKDVKIFTAGGRLIEPKFPHLVEEFLQSPQESFILDGELVKYKGNSRLSHKDVASYVQQASDVSSSKRNNQQDYPNFKLKIFDLLYLNGQDVTSFPLEKRKELLENHFADSNFVQKVKYTKASSFDLSSRIKGPASAEGAMVKSAKSGYFEEESWYKWKRHLDLDVLVTGVEKNKGGTYNYSCGVGAKANPVPLGCTYSTPLVVKIGDIIRVRVDRLIRSNDGFAWRAPRVLEQRSDKDEPDPISVLERMIGAATSADGRPLTAAQGPDLVEVGARASDRFVLQLHWWGKAKHHDLRFQDGNAAFGLTIFELDLDELNRGRRFLCEWKDRHDARWMDFEGEIPPQEEGAEGNPSRGLVAHMRILDKGKYEIVKRKADFSSFKIEGKVLNGIYLARQVRLKQKDRWLFWKRSTD
ncbi:MAG: hypothetical protein GTO24_16165 [candidate division Zixibacteria bacterium]|nr:hypothetical protein [candidate division Zixibacteria bacterium]